MNQATLPAPRSPSLALLAVNVRLLLPLLISLFVVWAGLALQWSGLIDLPAQWQLSPRGEWLLMLPVIWCVGAPTMLVSGQRDPGHLDWIRTLPIPPSTLFRMQLLSALIGWGLLQAAAIACVTWSGVQKPWTVNYIYPQYAYHPLSVGNILLNALVLGCGFYFSWRIKNAIVGLMLVFATVLVGGWISMGLSELAAKLPQGVNEDFVSLLAWGFMAALAFAMARRAAVSQMSAAPSAAAMAMHWPRVRSTLAWIASLAQPELSASSDDLRTPSAYSFSALLWLYIRQGRPVLLISLAALIALGCTMVVNQSWIRAAMDVYSPLGPVWNLNWFYQGVIAISGFVGLVATSCLGVYAFSGTGSHTQCRFLADRGISPTRLWFSRQLISVSILATAGLLSSMTLDGYQRWISVPSIQGGSHQVGVVISLAAVLLVGGLVLSISQYISQLCQRVTLACLFAPVVCAVYFMHAGNAVLTLGMSPGLIVLCVVVPLIASWWSMRDFIDQRRPFHRWCVAAGVALLMAIIPTVNAAKAVLTYPSVSSQEIASWKQQLSSLGGNSNPIYLPLAQRVLVGVKPNQDSDDLRQAESPPQPPPPAMGAVDLTSEQERSWIPYYRIRPLKMDPNALSQGVAIEHANFEAALGGANLARFTLQSDPQNEQAAAQWSQWIETLSDATVGLRNSTSLVSCQQADAIEVWMTRVLSDRATREAIEPTILEKTIARLSDHNARDQSRQRAVLGSWYRSTHIESKQADMFGGININNDSTQRPPWWTVSTDTRRKDLLCAALLDLIQAGQSNQSTEAARRQLHELMYGNELHFQHGPYSDRYRAGADNHRISFAPGSQILWVPGSQWYAGWERVKFDPDPVKPERTP